MASYYDIINDYDWTSMPKGSPLRYNAPQLFVKSYRLNKNQSIERIKSYANVIQNKDPLKFYDELYKDATTPVEGDGPDGGGAYYLFPFFGDQIRNFSNTFGDSLKNGFGGDDILSTIDNLIQTYGGIVTDSVTKIKSAVSGEGNPGSYIETPKMYDFASANEGSLKVDFILSNTIDAASIQKNYDFITHIMAVNRPTRIDSISMEPPRIYEVTLKGWRYMRWAYCKDISVSFLGARKMIDNKIVPEGYAISMSFEPLTLEPSNFIKTQVDGKTTSFLSNTSGGGFAGAPTQQ
jgi:hypothetical protein